MFLVRSLSTHWLFAYTHVCMCMSAPMDEVISRYKSTHGRFSPPPLLWFTCFNLIEFFATSCTMFLREVCLLAHCSQFVVVHQEIIIDVNNLQSVVSPFSVFASATEGQKDVESPILHLWTNNFLSSVFFTLLSLSQQPPHQRDFLLNWDCHMVHTEHPLGVSLKSILSTTLSGLWFWFSRWPLTCSSLKPLSHPKWNQIAF